MTDYHEKMIFLYEAFWKVYFRTKVGVLIHRLRKRKDWTRNFRSVILRPISAQFTTMTVVHFQGTYFMTQTTNLEHFYDFELSAMSTLTFGVKYTFQKALLQNFIFYENLSY
jgi:hypothetical protein